MLTFNTIKDWILEPRKKDDGLSSHYITQASAEGILKVWKSTDFAELRDGNGNLLEIVSRKDYRIRKSNEIKDDKSDRVWVCDYGVSHPMFVWPSDRCGCKEKYGSIWQFKEREKLKTNY